MKSNFLFLCYFTPAISLFQENPNDSNLAIFIAILGLFPSHLSYWGSTASQCKGRTQPTRKMRPQSPKQVEIRPKPNVLT